MTSGKVRLLATLGGATMAIGGAASPALAQTAGDQTYQDFFAATVCNPSNVATVPLFLARCSETNDNGVFANISSNSESSLNPTQASVAASNALAKAQALAQETEARLEAIRGKDEGKPGASTGEIASFGPWSLFTNVEGEWFDQSRPAFANERGFDGNRYRGTIGADYRLDAGSHVGFMASYEKYKLTFDQEASGANFNPQDNAGGQKSKSFAGTVFASFSLSDSAWADASAGFARSDNDFRRKATFQPSTRTLSRDIDAVASAHGNQYFVSLGTGFDLSDGAWTFGPYVRGRYVRSTINGYAERDLNNTGLEMRVGKQRATSLTSLVGANASYAISASWGVVLPQVRIEYEHEFKDDTRAIQTSLVRDAAQKLLTVRNDAPDRNHFNAGAGLLFVLPNGVMPYVDYEGLIGYRNFTRHRVTLGLRLEL